MSVTLVKYFYQFLQTVGTNDETAPTTDTAPAGQNGRLQRVAQHLTSALTKLDAINTKLDTSPDLTATNTKLDTANTAHTATNTKLDTVDTSINNTKTSLETKLDTIIAALNTANGLLLDIKNKP